MSVRPEWKELMKIKQRISKFCNTLKPMTWAQRLDHIWSYYKYHMLIGGVCLLMTAALLSTFFINNREVVFSGVFINTDITAEAKTYLTDELLETMDGDPESQMVDVSYSLFEDMETVTELELNYNRTTAVIAQIEARSLDYMVMDLTALDYYATRDVFGDLRQLLPEAVLEQYTLIYAREEDSREEIPVALEITHTNFVQKCTNAEARVFLAFPGNTDRTYTPAEFLKYLTNWS